MTPPPGPTGGGGLSAEIDDIATTLGQLSERLADVALDLLRTATSAARSPRSGPGPSDPHSSSHADVAFDTDADGGPAPRAAILLERRVTRARRAVEKAAALLADADRPELD